jgi:hypothetical protein
MEMPCVPGFEKTYNKSISFGGFMKVSVFNITVALVFGGTCITTAAPSFHPAYTFTSLLKSDFEPIVGDMDWMPDGRLAVVTLLMKNHDHQSGPSDVFILDGVLKGGPDLVTVKKFASGFYTPQGLKVVDGYVYVLDNREGIIRLTDADKNDIAETRTVIWTQGIKSSDRKWSGGLAYRDGNFYVPTSVAIIEGGRSATTQPAMCGVVLKVAKDGSKGESILGGLRNSNGIAFGPGGEMYLSDNQGDWSPASKISEARPGDNYGHAGTEFANKPVTPPLAWLPYGEVSRSPSAPLILTKGPYAGQMLLGEVTMQNIMRVSIDKVGGRQQGCVFPFAWDMPAGVNRMLEAPDGSGSIILGGVGGDGGWTLKEPWYDLERMTLTKVVPFEMLAVHSLSPSAMEIEFTKPIAKANAIPTSFRINQWRYVPTADYGGNKVDSKTLTVSSVALSDDGIRAVLNIAGLAKGNVVQIHLNNLKSKDGATPWSVDGYYTLNAFGPPEAMPAASLISPRLAKRKSASNMALDLSVKGTGWRQSANLARPHSIQIVGADGRVVRDFTEKIRP